MSTFLLGAWLSGCLFMAFLTVHSLRAASLVMSSPAPAVSKLIAQIGWDQMSALLRHAAAEQMRHSTQVWMITQLVLGLALLWCLVLATERRVLPLALCGIMLIFVLFQLRVAPEMTYQGRETDFAPGSLTAGALARFWALRELYFGAEILKFLCGGALASYLFAFRVNRRSRKESPRAGYPPPAAGQDRSSAVIGDPGSKRLRDLTP